VRGGGGAGEGARLCARGGGGEGGARAAGRSFFLGFFKAKLLKINLKMEHCGAFYAPAYHKC